MAPARGWVPKKKTGPKPKKFQDPPEYLSDNEAQRLVLLLLPLLGQRLDPDTNEPLPFVDVRLSEDQRRLLEWGCQKYLSWDEDDQTLLSNIKGSLRSMSFQTKAGKAMCTLGLNRLRKVAGLEWGRMYAEVNKHLTNKPPTEKKSETAKGVETRVGGVVATRPDEPA